MSDIEVFEQFKWDVYKTCFYMLQDKHEAEDMTQNVFITIFSYDYSKIENLKAWIITISMNMCKNYLKRQKRIIIMDNIREKISDSSKANDNSTQLEQSQLKGEIHELLSNLPEKCRSVVVLKYLHDMKYGQISQILGITEGAAKSNCNYALKLLRKKMSNHNLVHILEEGI